MTKDNNQEQKKGEKLLTHFFFRHRESCVDEDDESGATDGVETRATHLTTYGTTTTQGRIYRKPKNKRTSFPSTKAPMERSYSAYVVSTPSGQRPA